MLDLVVRGGRTADGESVDIGAKDGRIVSVVAASHSDPEPAAEVINAAGLLVLPGVVDAHVHLVDLFGVDIREVIRSETEAAAAGGVTTVGNFPLGVTGDLVEHLAESRTLIDDYSSVDIAVSYPILSREQVDEMDDLFALGVTSFKMLRAYRAPDVYTFGGIDDALLYRVMLKVAEMRERGKRALLKVHCENVEIFKYYKEELETQWPDLGRDEPLTDVTWAHCRPAVVEAESVNSAVYLAEQTQCPILIVHLSAALSLEPIRRAKARGLELYVETTPLYLETDAYSTGCPNGPPWTRVQPSVKFKEDADALWEAVRAQVIDLIGTDHAANVKAAYHGKSVWEPGASGRSILALMLPLMLNAVAEGKLTLERLRDLICEGPARSLNLDDSKGRIASGYDCDLVLCDLSAERTVTVDDLHSWADHSPFEGRTLRGWPTTTILRGQVIWRDGELVQPNLGTYAPGANP